MTTEEIKKAFAYARGDICLAAENHRNCTFADVDADGDVWIEGPMLGHWMSDEELHTLAEWIERETGQSLAVWCGLALFPMDATD